MKIMEHLIKLLAADELDNVGVYIFQQEDVGTSCMQTPGWDIRFEETEVRSRIFTLAQIFLVISTPVTGLVLKLGQSKTLTKRVPECASFVRDI